MALQIEQVISSAFSHGVERCSASFSSTWSPSADILWFGAYLSLSVRGFRNILPVHALQTDSSCGGFCKSHGALVTQRRQFKAQLDLVAEEEGFA